MDEKDMSAMLTHWELEHYRQLYRNQIDRLVDTLTVRLLPTFDSVHAEVEALQEEAYRASQECDNDGNRLDPQMPMTPLSKRRWRISTSCSICARASEHVRGQSLPPV
jgi:hypothetical protein